MREKSRSPDIPPARRRQEVAAILAAGVLRHRHAAKAAACPALQKSASFSQNCLGSSDGPRPCVPAGSGGYGPREP